MHLIFEQYDEYLVRLRRSESYRRSFARTAHFFEESGLDPTTVEDWQLEEFITGLPVSPRTQRLHAEILSSAFGYAERRRNIPASPMETVRLPREADKEPRILEAAELRTILDATTNTQDVLLAHLLIYTGMRRAEVQSLRWEDVNLDRSTITVVAGKGGKLRKVPIHPALWDVLEEVDKVGDTLIHTNRRCGAVASENALWKRLERIKGGVDCTFHTFRRTVATSLVTNAVPTQVVDRILGWAPRTVQSRYYVRVADETMQKAILRLYADEPL